MRNFIIFTLALTILSCKNDKDSDNRQGNSNDMTAKPTKVYALIFCDLTSSVDSILIKDVAGKAYDLIQNLPQGSRLEAYPIDDNTYADPIFSCEIPLLKSNLSIDKNNFNEQVKALGNRFGNSIFEKYKVVNSADVSRPSSCIISTLETAYNFFKDKNNDEYTPELIYFSDMIEQCANSQAGAIYICGSKYDPNKNKIINQLDEKYKPSFNLKSLIKNNISMIVTTGLIGSEKCLRSDEQREIWSKVFSKVGYSDADFNTFHFRQGLPDRLIKK